MKLKERGGFEDFLFSASFGPLGTSWEEEQDQLHIFAEEVMPVLKRECGGSPEMPALGLDWQCLKGPT
jgi:hypothetical protein